MFNFANFPPEPTDVTLSLRARHEIEEQVSTSGFHMVSVIECGHHAASFLLDVMVDPSDERILAAVDNAALDIVNPLSHYQFRSGAKWHLEDIQRGKDHEVRQTEALDRIGATV